MSVDDLASEEALLGDLSHAEHNELDLYGDADNFDHLDTAIDDKHIIESNGDGLLNDKLLVMDHNVAIKGEDDNDDELYNAVITERSSPNGNSMSGGASLAAVQLHITGSGTQQRKYSCYVGNLTWWTTDQDLVDVVMSAGITDILDVKFYENRQNGQSKGFALVSFNSEQSVQSCMVKLVGKQVHGQQLVVLPYTKHSLAQFEAATRKPNERTQSGGSVSPNAAEILKAAGVPKPGRPGGPTFIGTFRIGMVQPPPASSQPHMPATIAIHQGPPPTGHQILRTPVGAPPPPGAILIRSAPPSIVSSPFPPPPHRSGMPPPGGQLILPPPLHQRPPPHHVRLSGPPPGVLTHGMPPPGSHVNPNFYPNIAAAAAGGGGPASQALPPSSANDAPLGEAEFEEIMNRNRTVSSSAISRAVSDASAGDFASAIETLVTAISLIRQSKVSHDDRCKILISSLQDTLRGIEAKSFGGGSGGGGGGRMSSKDRDRRSRSRDRSKRRRERSRSRSRSRDRFEEYSPRRRRY